MEIVKTVYDYIKYKKMLGRKNNSLIAYDHTYIMSMNRIDYAFEQHLENKYEEQLKEVSIKKHKENLRRIIFSIILQNFFWKKKKKYLLY